ncbi:MAG: T9SS type A sorting domain-containing protein [Reichenbachiella sp.]
MKNTYSRHFVLTSLLGVILSVQVIAQCPGSIIAGGPHTITAAMGTCSYSAANFNGNQDIIIEDGAILQITITGTRYRLNGATITVEDGGELEINGGDIAIVNGGSLIVNGGTPGGLLDVNGGDVDVGRANGTNAGSITLDGTAEVSGTFFLNAQGAISGAGTIDAGGIDDSNGGNDTNWTGDCSGDCGTLPVELVSFSGSQEGNHSAILSWSTSSELNNEGFYIEKSINDTDFAEIGFVEGNGTVNEPKSYGFIDYEFVENAYYRLKQVDYDGQFEHHKIIAIEHQSSEIVKIYPNPIVHDQISIGGSSTDAFDAHLIGISGKEIFKMTGTLSEIENELNNKLSSLEASVYLLKLTSSFDSQTLRFIKG